MSISGHAFGDFQIRWSGIPLSLVIHRHNIVGIGISEVPVATRIWVRLHFHTSLSALVEFPIVVCRPLRFCSRRALLYVWVYMLWGSFPHSPHSGLSWWVGAGLWRQLTGQSSVTSPSDWRSSTRRSVLSSEALGPATVHADEPTSMFRDLLAQSLSNYDLAFVCSQQPKNSVVTIFNYTVYITLSQHLTPSL